MIELGCPKCNTDLDIDEAFRGSVCRCFKCGTLFIVPKDAGGGAEELTRPERPEAPGVSADGTYDLAPFRTPTGKAVRITDSQMSAIPVAQGRRKRAVVRGSTAGVVVALLVALVGAVGYGFYRLFTGEPERTVDEVYSETFDIVRNPFLETEPGFFTLPVGGANVLMFDTSASMTESLDAVRVAVIHSVTTLRGDHRVQVVAWSERGEVVHPGRLLPRNEVSIDELSAALGGLLAEGATDPGDSIARALGERPNHIFMVLRRPPPAGSIARYVGAMTGLGIKLTVIQIDGKDEELAALCEQTGGRLVELASGRLRGWFEEFLAKPVGAPDATN